MCGLTGYWTSSGTASERLGQTMADRIAHRGPDGHGSWVDPQEGVVLAHRRLAIIDLSAAGHQPMHSRSGRFVLSYNGEIYNHLDLRKQLEADGAAQQWAGHSDTETLLAAIDHWGLVDTLKRLNGMFAFALWDRTERRLFLARDRMGEKPLHYGRIGRTFFFGSELKSFAPHPDWSPEIDRSALSSFLRYSYVPGPECIYQNIAKLSPAHFVEISDRGRQIGVPRPYWDVDAVARQGTGDTLKDEREALAKLEDLLLDSVRLRMAADVPLGAFLSGGIDSTLVVALMQAQSTSKVRTFTIGFDEREYNEAQHAAEVARHLGTDHTELYVSPSDALDVIPTLPAIWDEPFADSSQIPTLLLSRLTRQHVTVSLSGDGGDELFCGYNRYAQGYSIWKKLSRLPMPARQVLASVMGNAPRGPLLALERLLPARFGAQNLPDRLPKLAEVVRERSDRNYYRRLVSHWHDADSLVVGADGPRNLVDDASWNGLAGILDRMMLADMKTYLPDDILVKVDRASMAVSLEARVPLLDHRLVELAWKIPTSMKYRDGIGKHLLREVLYRYVPRSIMDRPKMGFGVPIDTWLLGPLREWAEDLLSERKLRQQGYFNPEPIRRKWHEHVSGSRRWHYPLWDVLMFQAWLEHAQTTGIDARAAA